ncbi:leucine-rich repeat-containing protein 30-like [Heterodontus francisci]|uniref:leucine-rich repeat-containing protein 30-like n=1 Tax=Heterodontus francisci TaxID=7792 RepID=UPI00355BA59C
MSTGRLESAQTSLSLYSAKGMVGKLWKYRMEIDPSDDGKKKLKLKGRELLSAPLEIFDLGELQVLEMSPERESCLNYRMGTVPREIGQLSNLTVLKLDTNELREIPAEVGALQKLEMLTLSNNQLSSLPAETERLQQLQSLHLASNNFQQFPVQVCQLRRLSFLDASDNKIKSLPHSISNLERLETLLLYFNALQSLPDSICTLVSLCTLWLGKNQLRSLPNQFGQLVNLEWGRSHCSSNFEDNPLESPPPEICRGGPEEISRYFAVWDE